MINERYILQLMMLGSRDECDVVSQQILTNDGESSRSSQYFFNVDQFEHFLCAEVEKSIWRGREPSGVMNFENISPKVMSQTQWLFVGVDDVGL